MSGKAIDYKIILARDGQTQGQRMPQWLPPEAAPIDNRSEEELWNYAKKIADEMLFFDTATSAANSTWKEFFDLDAATVKGLAQQKALPPHLALFYSFLQLYKEPQQLLNGLTGRHLDFYYNDVLGLQKKPATPHKVHVVFERKKGALATLVPAGTKLVGGKEIFYSLQHDTIVNGAVVSSLRSLYVNPAQKNFLHYAPVANSADGIGEALPPLQPKWSGFGNNTLPLAKPGFALSSDVLRMKEGQRKITVLLEVDGFPQSALANGLANLFELSITGEKGWIGPKAVSPTVEKSTNNRSFLTLAFLVSEDEAAVVNYDAALHGLDFDAAAPVLQVLLNTAKGDFGYNNLKGVSLLAATIDVEVSGLKELQLENDYGTLNAKKPFLPFGATPEEGASFYVGCEEAFSKSLKKFAVNLVWKNIPDADLSDFYKAYAGYNIKNNSFTATASFKDGGSWRGSDSKQLFNTNATAPVTLSFSNPSFALRLPLLALPLLDVAIKPVKLAGTSIGKSLLHSISVLKPTMLPQFELKKDFVLQWIPYFRTVASKKGFLTLRLNQSFLFREYREIYANAVLAFSKQPGAKPSLPKEPFAPEVLSIELSYTATSGKISKTDSSLTDYINTDIRFYHLGAFGQMREHLYQQARSTSQSGATVKLLPQYGAEGELYIGLSGLEAEETVNLLFQVAEGSANPDKPKATIDWSVLCDNYWKPLGSEHLIFDTTNSLLTSGVIRFLLPGEATATNTLLPAGFIWIKASIQQDADAVSQLIDVQANAAIAEYVNDNKQPEHLSSPLPPSSITKLATPVGAVKSVKQPFGSFGGSRQEDTHHFYTRVSERLRHKSRSIALWDYERLILEHFPQIHKVKCIPHATETSFYEPGHTLTVVVPHLQSEYAVNPFQPRVDKNTLDQVLQLLQTHSSPWAVQRVSNPQYEPVKIAVSIALKRGKEFHYYQKEAEKGLQAFLSPWIGNNSKEIMFGGKVTKSMIVQFLEKLDYVDYIVDLRLFQSVDGGQSFGSDKEVAEVSNPAAILVSHTRHEITNYA